MLLLIFLVFPWVLVQSDSLGLDPGPSMFIHILQKITPPSWNSRWMAFGKTVPIRRLGRYNIDPKFTVSGISAGGSFTAVASFTMSDIMKGAGIFAGGTHTVAPATFSDLRNLFDYRSHKEWTDKLAREKLIPDLNNFKHWTGAYIHHGLTDTVVPPAWDKMNADLYRIYGVPKVKSVILKDWGTHCIPTAGYGNVKAWCPLPLQIICGCGYCSVCDMFSVVLENYKQANLTKPTTGKTYRFFQTEFVDVGDTQSVGMEDFGWLYVPERCEPETGITCELHFYFPGCYEALIAVITGWVPHWFIIYGYAENADANDVILIVPQSRISWNPGNFSNGGCWDHYSYTNLGGIRHATMYGPQPLAMRKMYERIHYGK